VGQQAISKAKSDITSLEILESGIAIIRLGDPSERTVCLTEARLASLRDNINSLKTSSPKGLIIIGSSPEMFSVGVDVSILKQLSNADEAEKLARTGQSLFNDLARLSFPTIAAISGPCAGGACELALACDYRLISDHGSSVIGLPEIKLGILPGFGGTQRLPRLVGLPRSLDIILKGKMLKPKQAYSFGLVHEIVNTESLQMRAEEIILRSAEKPRLIWPGFFNLALTKSRVMRLILKEWTKHKLNKFTRGHYPAPPAALEVIFFGLDHGLVKGLEREAHELGQLIVTQEAKNLANVFFLIEASKRIGKTARNSVKNIHALVAGAGRIGSGLAGVLANNNCQVVLSDRNRNRVKIGYQQIKQFVSGIKHLSTTEKSFVLNRIAVTSIESANAGNSNFIFEASGEDLETKQKTLSYIEDSLSSDIIIATDTSTLPLSEISKTVAHPDRLVGLHLFNPVEKTTVVEIVRTKQTGDKAIVIAAALANKIDKYPLVVGDTPGFLVNRILFAGFIEAEMLIKDGYSVKKVDQVARSFGIHTGPFEKMDNLSLETVQNHLQQS
jgi:3-hydroxyacyl-CoA dehydrogenase / enoyl-CoA hydratase / 3-hydroxybutyryl-CoA epimerase